MQELFDCVLSVKRDKVKEAQRHPPSLPTSNTPAICCRRSLTFASKHTPCLNTSSLCTGSLRSCASSTRLYLVTPGIAASVPAPLPLDPGVFLSAGDLQTRALPRLLPPPAPPPPTPPPAATLQAPLAAGNTSPGGHPGRGATAASVASNYRADGCCPPLSSASGE